MKTRDCEEAARLINDVSRYVQKWHAEDPNQGVLAKELLLTILENALTRAREEGRMEILARMPTEVEVRDYFQWSSAVQATTPLQAFEVINWLRSRLDGK